MSKKFKLILISAVIVVAVAVIVFISLDSSKDKKDDLVIEDNYNHDNAKRTAIEQGYADESLNDVELGMSVDEVNTILDEKGEVTYELENKKKVEYSALKEDYVLEVIFEDEKVIGVSLVKIDE